VTSPDLALAQRLERAEASANVAFVEARARMEPAVGATWIEVAGAYAMFDGVGSPLTQTFGVGLFDPIGVTALAELEAFFTARGSSTSHEISTLSAGETLRLLQARGYTAIEHSTVWVRPTIASPDGPPPAIDVRRIDRSEFATWARVSAQGWSSAGAEVSAFVEQFGTIMAEAHGVTCFLAEVDAEPIAAAALNMTTDVALLAGASTVPSARGRGAQRALLDARLAYAAAQGIDLAMIVTQPEGPSKRNAERVGFRPVYNRSKWERVQDRV
jgi:GNAT superfamily N-acetyltransferase